MLKYVYKDTNYTIYTNNCYREGDIKSPKFLNTRAGRQSRVWKNQNNQKSAKQIIKKVKQRNVDARPIYLIIKNQELIIFQ